MLMADDERTVGTGRADAVFSSTGGRQDAKFRTVELIEH
jgi:hypothetical protein